MFVASYSRTMANAQFKIAEPEHKRVYNPRKVHEVAKAKAERAARKAAMDAEFADRKRRANAAILAANKAIAALHLQWEKEEALERAIKSLDAEDTHRWKTCRVFVQNELRMDVILKRVSRALGISPHAMLGKSREHNVVFARQAFYYWATRRTSKFSTEIARFIDKDHTCIIHGKRAYVAKRKAMGRNLREAR